MREIKFRAWNEARREMSDNVQDSPFFGEILNSTDNEVMQFTGLKDKNGKEIYEGDVLQYEESKRIFQVSWDNETSCYYAYFIGKHPSDPFINKLGGWELGRAAIIGNIYENPELLKSRTEPKL